jgi:hypothetical protein
MRHGIYYVTAIAVLLFSSCIDFGKRVEGNGKIVTENRHASRLSKIKLQGHLEVIVEQGAESVKVETDENLLPYIITENEGDWLKIKTKDHINFSTSQPIKVYVSSPEIRSLSIDGSGDITGKSVFTSSEKMSFEISGSGDIEFSVHAPYVDADISGSGNLHLAGETKEVAVDVAGSGNYNGGDLKAETARVNVAGSGNAFVFADINLKASVAGSGGIKYRGNATIEKDIAGSGSVMKAE